MPTNAQRLVPTPALTNRDFRSTRQRDFSKLNAMKTKYLAVSVALLLGLVAFLPQAEAVVPPPDGGYPGFTTAEGTNALKNLSSGVANTANGWYSLFSDTTGSFNTGVGGGALALNNADSNTAIGAAAMLLNTIGERNVAVGTDAFVNNDSGSSDNAVGAFALFNNIDGFSNNAFGDSALLENIDGFYDTAIGYFALTNNDNTGLGLGSYNTAVGALVLFNNTDGASDTAVGYGALSSNTTGNGNTADGLNALPNNITGNYNTAIGAGALIDSTGDNNTALGYLAGLNVTTASNVIAIGTDGQDVSNTCYIGQIFGATSTNGIAVFINSDGRLGTVTSSGRFKEDVIPMERASEAIFALKPIAFHYKKEIDPAGKSQFGLLAEDVEKVNRDLVILDKEGKPYSVRYDQVNAMLLNEFLKEHKAFVEEQRKVEQQQKEIDALKTGLKEQRTLIEKVNDKMELKASASQTTANNQ
jgi:hypothetical protein